MELQLKSPKYGKFTVYYDDEDQELVAKHKWYIYFGRPNMTRKYATTSVWVNGKGDSFGMHRYLMGFPKGLEVDHIDGDGLNNRRSNLRIVTHGQNNMNKGIQKSNTIGYKGVYFYEKTKRQKKYWAYIWVGNKRISGGYFEKIEEAAKKYNELAALYHKEFAKFNIINI